MQVAGLSAYHTGEPQRPTTKTGSLLNEADSRSESHNDAYEFIDNAKKVSYLTGSARCTLVTASASIATTNHPANTSHNATPATMSRIRFGKSSSR